MRAVVLVPRRPDSAHLTDVPMPAPRADEVLVRMIRGGICGTDTELNQGAAFGEAPPGADYIILGHENFGQVEWAPPSVSRVKKGDYVVATVRRPCGCLNCAAGESDMCTEDRFTERGIRRQHGFLAEYYVERAENLIPIPPHLKQVAVLLEPYSIVAKGIWQAWKAQQRLVWQPRTALVFGAGTIGLLAALALRARGLEVVIAARSRPGTVNSEIARAAGAHYVSLQETPLADIPRLLAHRVDVIFEASGHGPHALAAMELISPNGVVILNSVTTGHNPVTLSSDALNMRLVLGNNLILGIVNANIRYFEMGVRDFDRFEELWRGLLPRLLTRRVPLADFTLDLLNRRYGVKTTIEISSE